MKKKIIYTLLLIFLFNFKYSKLYSSEQKCISSNGVPNHAEAKATIEAASVIVDTDVSLAQLKFTGNTPGTVTFTRTGNKKLTMVGDGGSMYGLQLCGVL